MHLRKTSFRDSRENEVGDEAMELYARKCRYEFIWNLRLWIQNIWIHMESGPRAPSMLHAGSGLLSELITFILR